MRIVAPQPISKQKVKQVFTLYVSMVLTLVVGIGVSVLNTRFLGPQQFGDYKFLQALFNFAVLFFTLGFFTTGSYMLAQNENDSIDRELTGSILSLAMVISIVFTVAIIGFSYFQGKLFDNKLDGYIRLFSPLLLVYPFQLCMTNIFQGTNRIIELSVFRLLPPVLYILVAASIAYFDKFSLFYALLTQFATFLIVIIFLAGSIKPSFKNRKQHTKEIFKTNRKFGFPVYIGAIANVASAQLGSLSVAYFMDNISVGYFSLAVTITTPLMMIPNVVGTTFFKEFSNSATIPLNVIIATLILSVIALGGFLIVAEWVIVLLYSKDYQAVVNLSYILSVGCFFHGFGDLVNRFLAAHGQGRYLRNGAIVVGIINLLGYVFLVQQFGITGAAMTRLSAGIVYLAIMIFFYQKSKSEEHYVI